MLQTSGNVHAFVAQASTGNAVAQHMTTTVTGTAHRLKEREMKDQLPAHNCHSQPHVGRIMGELPSRMWGQHHNVPDVHAMLRAEEGVNGTNQTQPNVST
ncbi:hypothetical protein TNCT_87091 [Trichonephila clavata]|uniref:Uncharacterized protein n=1 Tax=Trichonephila clavata TaxID=2740835 RepID=A0A8X6GSJ9_TRICU|nr:hypothetical protein TNCT_87091 [Trichonephila clavata]